ncbi:MAG: sigma-70 family RNA polymerase sigma factor [Oscillospiraceae bacterium]
MEDEQKIIAKAQNGDQDAFALLMEHYQGKIFSLTLRLTNSRPDAEELTQETFFKAWRGLSGFHGESSLGTWLYRLASNVCIDFLRREKRRSSLSITVPLDEDGQEDGRQLDLPDTRFTPQGELEKKELREAVARGLSQLSEEHRKVLVLRELEGLSYGEIGELLELEEGTVKSRIARARGTLRKVLLADGNFFGRETSE